MWLQRKSNFKRKNIIKKKKKFQHTQLFSIAFNYGTCTQSVLKLCLPNQSIDKGSHFHTFIAYIIWKTEEINSVGRLILLSYKYTKNRHATTCEASVRQKSLVEWSKGNRAGGGTLSPQKILHICF